MATAQYSDNFTKFLLFYYKPGNDVLIKVLQWLYVGQTPIEHHLVDLSESYNMTADQKASLEELKTGKKKLGDLDTTLLYAIIQRTCGLAPGNAALWDERCPPNRQNSLEYLLFTLKAGRNKLADPSFDCKNVSDSDVEKKCEEMKKLLTSILQRGGQIGNVDTVEVNDVVEKVSNDLIQIYKYYTRPVVEPILPIPRPIKPPPPPTLDEIILKALANFYIEQEKAVSDFFQPVEGALTTACSDASRIVTEICSPVEELAISAWEDASRGISEVGAPVEELAKSVYQETANALTEVCQPIENFAKSIFKW